jgi:ADP-heptose:LPS heptosyltransferase
VRSLPVEALAPLLLDPRYDWVALQHGEAYAQAYRLGDRLVHNLGKAANDLADTAAILRNFDLLVSIDSAPVHLAGAMGLPCWVLLDAAPDWRWGRIGGETPWYPNMRLFRQPVTGNWGQVLVAVSGALEDFSPGSVSK